MITPPPAQAENCRIAPLVAISALAPPGIYAVSVRGAKFGGGEQVWSGSLLVLGTNPTSTTATATSTLTPTATATTVQQAPPPGEPAQPPTPPEPGGGGEGSGAGGGAGVGAALPPTPADGQSPPSDLVSQVTDCVAASGSPLTLGIVEFCRNQGLGSAVTVPPSRAQPSPSASQPESSDIATAQGICELYGAGLLGAQLAALRSMEAEASRALLASLTMRIFSPEQAALLEPSDDEGLTLALDTLDAAQLLACLAYARGLEPGGLDEAASEFAYGLGEAGYSAAIVSRGTTNFRACIVALLFSRAEFDSEMTMEDAVTICTVKFFDDLPALDPYNGNAVPPPGSSATEFGATA